MILGIIVAVLLICCSIIASYFFGRKKARLTRIQTNFFAAALSLPFILALVFCVIFDFFTIQHVIFTYFVLFFMIPASILFGINEEKLA